MKNFITAEKAKSLREINLCDQRYWEKRPWRVRESGRNPREERAGRRDSSNSVHEMT